MSLKKPSNLLKLKETMLNNAYILAFEEDGRMILTEIDQDSFIIKKENLKEILDDELIVNEDLLFELHEITKKRLLK